MASFRGIIFKDKLFKGKCAQRFVNDMRNQG